MVGSGGFQLDFVVPEIAILFFFSIPRIMLGFTEQDAGCYRARCWVLPSKMLGVTEQDARYYLARCWVLLSKMLGIT